MQWSIDHPEIIGHARHARENTSTYARGGVQHLILEVLADADEEARALGRAGTCVMTLHGDASLSISDDGRGTRDTADGRVVRKPVMATKDLRVHADLQLVQPVPLEVALVQRFTPTDVRILD